MTFGTKLSKLRKENNYTQEQLADMLGISRQSISKWESDIVYPETDKLIELGRLFECSMDYLLKDEVTEKNGASANFHEKTEEIVRKIMTEKNKNRARKILKIMVIILAVVLAIDISTMILYVWIHGVPQ